MLPEIQIPFTKWDVFHYVYAVLHHRQYRPTKGMRDVVSRPGEFRIIRNVAAEIQDMNYIEILNEVLSHTFGHMAGCEGVFRNERNHAFIRNPVGRPPDRSKYGSHNDTLFVAREFFE